MPEDVVSPLTYSKLWNEKMGTVNDDRYWYVVYRDRTPGEPLGNPWYMGSLP